jgi:hypothetical protein
VERANTLGKLIPLHGKRSQHKTGLEAICSQAAGNAAAARRTTVSYLNMANSGKETLKFLDYRYNQIK